MYVYDLPFLFIVESISEGARFAYYLPSPTIVYCSTQTQLKWKQNYLYIR